MGALNFYLTTFLICVLSFILDNGFGKLFLLFGLIKDPLRIKKNEISNYTKVPVSNFDKNTGQVFEFTDDYEKVLLKEN